jgi:hypothetical protein
MKDDGKAEVGSRRGNVRAWLPQGELLATATGAGIDAANKVRTTEAEAPGDFAEGEILMFAQMDDGGLAHQGDDQGVAPVETWGLLLGAFPPGFVIDRLGHAEAVGGNVFCVLFRIVGNGCGQNGVDNVAGTALASVGDAGALDGPDNQQVEVLE